MLGTAYAENPVLKIGFVGVTSGPAAAWGTSNQRSMETRAAWINETAAMTLAAPDTISRLCRSTTRKTPSAR